MWYVIAYVVGMFPAVAVAGYLNGVDREVGNHYACDSAFGFAVLLMLFWPLIVCGLIISIPFTVAVMLYDYGEKRGRKKNEK
jgi:hypothetical protein